MYRIFCLCYTHIGMFLHIYIYVCIHTHTHTHDIPYHVILKLEKALKSYLMHFYLIHFYIKNVKSNTYQKSYMYHSK